jgi:hypothetical protein
MNPEQREFLNLARRPARLNVEQVAWLLGFQVHDIPRLVAAGLLRPLGRPGPNAPKFFGTADLEAAMQDRKWLARASEAIQSYWRDQNARKPGRAQPRFRSPSSPLELPT